jgi:hypothetical protein
LPATVWNTRVTSVTTSWPDEFVAVFDHDHGAVGQVADALVALFAGLHHAHDELFAGQDDRADGVG